MSKIVAAGFLIGGFALAGSAQVPPPPPLPPLPDEIRPTIVEVAPPPLRAEGKIASPGPGYVWARGYWDWDGNSWEWIDGRWASAPVARATWVPATYTLISTGWRYVPGHWSNQRVITVSTASRGKAVGHKKAKGKGHLKGKGKGHAKHD
jgi:hypothetical protein